MFRELRIAAIAAFAGVLLLTGCGGGNDSEEPSSPLEDPAVTEAAPEAEPEPAGSGETAELEPSDREQVEAAVAAYISALNRGNEPEACALVPAGCGLLSRRQLGRAPRGGGPAWRRTRVNELESVSVGDGEARVTATVVHDYAGGDPGIGLEEDVIYLRQVEGGWLLAKPSGTFYRAVGFPTPPLRALTPP